MSADLSTVLKRPRNYFKLSFSTQWAIDKRLGILDWDGSGLSEDDLKIYYAYFGIHV